MRPLPDPPSLVLAAAGLAATLTPIRAQERPHPLRVLVAGVPEHARTQAFADFLAAEFADVGQIALAGLSVEATEGYDVVVAVPPQDVDPSVARTFVIPEGFDRPIVLVGVQGARMGENYDLKVSDG